MATMNAAVVTSFDEPPHYQQFDVPQPRTRDEVLVDVLAVGPAPARPHRRRGQRTTRAPARCR